MSAIFAYSLSIGPITWIYTSEVLPAKGVGIATTINWLTAWGLAKIAPKLLGKPIGVATVLLSYAGFTFAVNDNILIGNYVFSSGNERNKR